MRACSGDRSALALQLSDIEVTECALRRGPVCSCVWCLCVDVVSVSLTEYGGGSVLVGFLARYKGCFGLVLHSSYVRTSALNRLRPKGLMVDYKRLPHKGCKRLLTPEDRQNARHVGTSDQPSLRR